MPLEVDTHACIHTDVVDKSHFKKLPGLTKVLSYVAINVTTVNREIFMWKLFMW